MFNVIFMLRSGCAVNIEKPKKTYKLFYQPQ